MYLKDRLYRMAIALVALAMVVPLLSVPDLTATGTSSITYEYHFSQPMIGMDGEEQVYIIEGLENDVGAGSPILPMMSLMLAVQPGESVVEVRVERSDAVELAVDPDYPCNPAESPTGTGSATYEESWHGPYEYAGSYVLEGAEIVCVDLWPIYMEQSTGALFYSSDFSVIIVTEHEDAAYIGDMDRVRELVDNPEDVPELVTSKVSGSSSVLPSGSYKYLIITEEDLSQPFRSLATWKSERNGKGSNYANIASAMVTLDYILADSSFWGTASENGGTGNDTQTMVRNFIKAAHQEWGVDYVLIGGDEDVIPSRKVYVTASSYTDDLPADIYYSALDGDWDSDDDGRYGETSGQGNAGEEADLLAEVYVGRAPVSTVSEAWNFVNKTILYEKSYVNQYDTDLLFVGEALDSRTYGDWYKDEVYDDVMADENLTLKTLYEEKGTFSGTAFFQGLRSGIHVVNHMGHGNYDNFGDLTVSNAMALDNDLPFVLYTQACMVAGFDQSSDSIAEKFVIGEYGAVAFIGNSRYGWYSPGSTSGTSQQYDLAFFSQVYDDGVTNLGKALSLSKEELASSAASAGTYRWVYMELNLLGDPETRMLMDTEGAHDLSVKTIVLDSCYWQEECHVVVEVQDRGQFSEEGTVTLYADGTFVDSTVVTLVPGQTTSADLYWTPALYQGYELRAVVTCGIDDVPGNDEIITTTQVGWMISTDTTWEDRTMTLAGGLLIEEGVTLTIRDCLVQLPAGAGMIIDGTLDADCTDFNGSDMIINSTGNVNLEGCAIEGLSTEERSSMNGGRLVLRNTIITGGMGWSLHGTDLEVLNSDLIDQTSEWSVSLADLEVQGLTGETGGGLRLSNVTGSLRNLTWTEADLGLAVEWSGSLLMHDISLIGNDVDIVIRGDTPSDFLQDIDEVEMTDGELSILYQEDGVTVNGTAASLYLVDCHDVVVSGMHLQHNGIGLAMIGCSDVSVVGNAIEECDVGIMSIGSDGTFWSNDLLSNERQVSQSSSVLTFNLDYPSGGNHWSDNDVVDIMSGEDQDQAGADGTDDHAYDTDDAHDEYPKVARCSFVYDVLTASFTASASSFDTLQEVTFTDRSSSGSGIANWTWDLGDGSVAYGRTADHLYSDKGAITVTLNVTDAKGCSASVSLNFTVVNHAPECAFSFSPSQPEVSETISFDDLSTDVDGTIVAWSWDFGDGTISTSSSSLHSFDAEGDFHVVLTVTDSDGSTDSYTMKVAVGNDAPVAGFQYSPTVLVGMQSATFTSDSTDPDGAIVQWSWDFGDGTVGSGSSVAHRFSKSGTYTVTLFVTDDDGAIDTVDMTVSVENAVPSASFGYQSVALTLENIGFTDGSADPDGRIVSWNWNFGDGWRSVLRSPKHAYELPGTYNVTLTVKDNEGATATIVRTITVLNRAPQASIVISGATFLTLDEVTMNAETEDLDGTVIECHWDFGDGTVASGWGANHSYTAPGSYTITLVVWDDEGATTSVSVNVTIMNRAPQVSMNLTSGDIWSLDDVHLEADATDLDGDVVSYLWDLGDGTNGTGPSIVHAYIAPGSYNVTLTCVDDLDGATTINMTIVVLDLPPVASIAVEQGTASPLDIALVANTSDLDGSVTEWHWEFGDGTIGDGASVLHRYPHEGVYDVNLTVTDDHGLSVTVTRSVDVARGSIVMSNVTCTSDDGKWTFTADLLNDGPLNVTVTLIVNASGVEHQKEVTLLPGQVMKVQIALDGFEGGDVSAEVDCDEAWDSDASDNVWAATVEGTEGSIGAIVIVVIVIACIAIVALVLWRRR